MVPKPGALAGGHTILGWETSEPIMGRKFSKVMLMGPHWSGTNAVQNEVLWRFNVAAVNPEKLQVCAADREAIQGLRNGLTNGPVLSTTVKVGNLQVPQGYKLEKISEDRLQRIKARGSNPPRVQVQEEPTSPAQNAVVGKVQQNVSFAELFDGVEPPIPLSFRPDSDGGCAWWKHAVRSKDMGSIDTDENTLVILVVKDPLFWLKSMSKHFYEIRLEESSQRRGLDGLFGNNGRLTHDGRQYRDAVELWSATVNSYLDDNLYPKDRCVLLRYEDFLFRFWDVMVHLSAFLAVNGERLKQAPNSTRAKTHGRVVRDRFEALKEYFSNAQRHCDFQAHHLARVCEVDSALLSAFGYDSIPTSPDAQISERHCCWVPKLHPGDIVAASFRCSVSGVAAGAEAFEDNLGNASASNVDERPGRVWARVVDTDEDGQVELELLRRVSREWLAEAPKDWSVVDFPPSRYRGCVLDRLPEQSFQQRVPREWVDLRLPHPSVDTSSTLPLTEEGYRAAVNLRSTKEMGNFITRVIEDLEVNGVRGGRVLDKRKLPGFARWFSGEAAVQSLAQIRRELPMKQAENWISFAPPPRPQRKLPEAPIHSAGADAQ